MREIKFRAWDKTNKCWLLGYELSNLGGFSLVGECILMGEWSDIFHPLTRINEVEIMQFTGFKDKNGKEIYEGDIWKRNTFMAEVIFSYAQWNLQMIPASGCYQYPYFYSNAVSGEVIGNIYENPELLDS